MTVKTCKDFADPKIGCCDSCHEDMNFDYSMYVCEVYRRDGTLFAQICCRYVNAAQAEADKADGVV